MAKKYVYLFKEGNANMRELLGGKGANLAEMTNLGMPVPLNGVLLNTAVVIQKGKILSSSRFMLLWRRPKRWPARSSATTRILSLFLSAPALVPPCPA
jgi:hypothetical protein